MAAAIDWSDGALISLHFALADFDEDSQMCDRFFYVLDTEWLIEKIPKLPKSKDSRRITEDWRGLRRRGIVGTFVFPLLG